MQSAPAANPHTLRNPREFVIPQSVIRAAALANPNTIPNTSQRSQHHPAFRNPPSANGIETNASRNPAIRSPLNDY